MQVVGSSSQVLLGPKRSINSSRVQGAAWPLVQRCEHLHGGARQARLGWAAQRPPRQTCRAAVGDLVTLSISGHATEAMQRHCSTVRLEEQRRGLANVLHLIRPSQVRDSEGQGRGQGPRGGGRICASQTGRGAETTRSDS